MKKEKFMMLGVQYYRPPFPEKKFWKEDLSKIRDSGFNTIQLWACWGWIEPKMGIFKFDDYDELISEGEKKGLNVIISTIAEIHPFWIHRIIPDSYMIDHMGNNVISSLRIECNVGLTPGGCTDHPKVQELMENFLKTIAKRYAGVKNLIGWDCWNETRWAVHADGY
ncbi:MAG TPA: beta-galactosidase, partial [Candidatus Ratteibacteria bacterium]|nr:beta-galactosidase [Candidatus Ratteibacteria bacterium]